MQISESGGNAAVRAQQEQLERGEEKQERVSFWRKRFEERVGRGSEALPGVVGKAVEWVTKGFRWSSSAGLWTGHFPSLSLKFLICKTSPWRAVVRGTNTSGTLIKSLVTGVLAILIQEKPREWRREA